MFKTRMAALEEEKEQTRLQHIRQESQESEHFIDINNTLLGKSTDHVQSITDTGADMDSTEMLPRYESDGTGVFSSDEFTGEESPLDNSGTDPTYRDFGVKAQDIEDTSGQSQDLPFGNIYPDTGFTGESTASGEESPLDHSSGDLTDSDLEVKAQEKRDASDEDNSGTDGDPNPSKIARCVSCKPVMKLLEKNPHWITPEQIQLTMTWGSKPRT